MRSGRGGGVCPPPGCPIRESSDRRVPAAPRGVSPRGRALHRPCRPRHPPRAHPRSRPCRAVRTRARAGQEPAPSSSGPSRSCLMQLLLGRLPTDRARHSLVNVPGNLAPQPRWRVVVRDTVPGRASSRRRATPPCSPSPRPGEGRGSPGYWGRGPARSERPRARPGMARADPRALPRKEVIQPQLPLRLPCYDFVPVSSPALDACSPSEKGFARRLQALPPPMT